MEYHYITTTLTLHVTTLTTAQVDVLGVSTVVVRAPGAVREGQGHVAALHVVQSDGQVSKEGAGLAYRAGPLVNVKKKTISALQGPQKGAQAG